MALQGFSIDAFSLLLGATGGIIAVVIFGLFPLLRLSREKAMLQMKLDGSGDEFRLLAQNALRTAQEDFLVLAGEKLKSAHNDGAHDLDKRHTAIAEMVKPLQKHLEILGNTVEQIKGTDQLLRDDLMNLTRQTARLSGALNSPTSQGKWGEYILEGLIENAGLIKGIHYVTQESTSTAKQRPDMIVNLNEKLKIVIDAKTPLNRFTELLDQDLNADDHAGVMKDLAAQVRSHILDLSKKGYWENIDSDSVDFTVLFLPSEQLFSMALRGDPALAELAHSKNVIIASPTLIMALMRVIKMGWRQVDLANNARAISEQGGVLYQRLVKFSEHMDKVGKGLSGALDGYNNAVGSLDRMVFPATRKLQELGVEGAGKTLPDLKIIGEEPRRLTGTE